MSKLLIFSGTSDGRILAEKLADAGHEITVCVATEYGGQVMPDNPAIKVHCGRMDEAHMNSFMSYSGMDAVIDATHPYAKKVSENIRRVCQMKKYQYYRLVRDSFSHMVEGDDIIFAEDALEAAKFVNTLDGNVFLSTGSKELAVYTENITDKERVYVRVLPNIKVLEEINKLGLSGSHIICMQGPFSEDLNYAMFQQINAKILVTKESGSAGGFMEKIAAARRAGMSIVLIRRPSESGYGLEDILRKFTSQKKMLSIVGIGMGSVKNMTLEVKELCEKSELLIGADRMLSAVSFSAAARKVSLYKPEQIADVIDKAQESKIVIVLSGDVGFYSGAKKLIGELKSRGYNDISVHPGVSTVAYLASKVNVSWDDMVFVSLHGREQNIVNTIKYNQKVFVLLGGADSVACLCKLLADNGFSEVKIFIGSNLSYNNERIVSGTAKDFLSYHEEGVSAVILINDKVAMKSITYGIADEQFIRERVPMTKEEVRTVSLSKLQLKENSVVYDIGAGSGSVSVECALCMSDGKVYAIEHKDVALKLIERNCEKFGVSNVELVNAFAPEIDKDIDNKMLVPTHAFIGGSGGRLSQILDWLEQKNPHIRIVINAIALETVAEATAELKRRKIENPEIVSINIAKSKQIGGYSMMMANNPVYIFSFNL